MQGGFKEPLVVADAVALQIGPHPGDVVLQAELRQGVMAGLLVAIEIFVALLFIEKPGKHADVIAVVAVLGKRHRVLASDDLEVAGLQAPGEFLDLVAGIVDIELTPHLRTGFLQHGGQRIAQHAAAGIAHVHGAGGVGGNKLHHVFLALEHIVAAVVGALVLNAGNGIGKPLVAQTEVQETGACDLHGGEVGAVKHHVLSQDTGDLTGIFAHGLGGCQTVGGGIVPVGGILGDLHRGCYADALGQKPCRRGLFVRGNRQMQDLVFGVLDHIHGRFLLILSSVQCERAAPIPADFPSKAYRTM